MVKTILVLAAAMALAPAAQARVCTERDATAADAMVDHLDSWPAVNTTFRKYGHCDDGEIAEGNSEAVARLLVDHWQSLPELGTLIRQDPPFRGFVLRHIDSTLDTRDLSRIKELSRNSCPNGMASLCRAMASAAARAAQ